jgi:hypothetical protein
MRSSNSQVLRLEHSKLAPDVFVSALRSVDTSCRCRIASLRLAVIGTAEVRWLTCTRQPRPHGSPAAIPSACVAFCLPRRTLACAIPSDGVAATRTCRLGLVCSRFCWPDWLAFLRFVATYWHGSVEPAMRALLLSPIRYLAPIAVVYAPLPVLGERRWRDAAVSLGLLDAVSPFLPWQGFLEHQSQIISATRREGWPPISPDGDR